MSLVGFIGANCGLLRYTLVGPSPGHLVAWGTIMMMNVLAFGLYRLATRPASRSSFAVGFVACGLLALVTYLGCAWLMPERTLSYNQSALSPIGALGSRVVRSLQPVFDEPFSPNSTYGKVSVAIIYGLTIPLGAVLISLPQLGLAIFGGLTCWGIGGLGEKSGRSKRAIQSLSQPD